MSSFWLEFILGALYVVLGPCAWLALALAMFKGRKRMRLLDRPPQPPSPLPAPPPRVSVLVPAKDEASQIGACVESILRQDYPELEVIAVDDRSADGTGAVLDEIAARDARVKVLRVRPAQLPAGWGGKNFALHRGVARARGEWLLFVDADVRLQPDAVRAALAVAEGRRFDLLSLLPRFAAGGFWEGLLQPLAGAATGAMFAVALTNANASRAAFANGQFMLVRRAAYERVGGHAAVRGTLSEDVALARRLKRAGLRPRLAWGDALASVRMYDSPGALVRGWARNFSMGQRARAWRILAAAAFVVLCGFSCYAAFAWGVYRNAHPLIAIGGWGWVATAVVHWLAMTALLAAVYAWAHSRRAYALLFPLGGTMLFAIFMRSLVMSVTGRVEWRGTSYTRRDLAEQRGRARLLPSRVFRKGSARPEPRPPGHVDAGFGSRPKPDRGARRSPARSTAPPP